METPFLYVLYRTASTAVKDPYYIATLERQPPTAIYLRIHSVHTLGEQKKAAKQPAIIRAPSDFHIQATLRTRICYALSY